MKSLLAMLVLMSASSAFAAGNNYHCVGTEPFWNAEVKGNTVLISLIGGKGQELPIVQRSYPQGTPSSFGEMIKARAGAAEATLTIRSDDKCNDGMSEALYSHEIWLLNGNRLLVGCCNKQ